MSHQHPLVVYNNCSNTKIIHLIKSWVILHQVFLQETSFPTFVYSQHLFHSWNQRSTRKLSKTTIGCRQCKMNCFNSTSNRFGKSVPYHQTSNQLAQDGFSGTNKMKLVYSS